MENTEIELTAIRSVVKEGLHRGRNTTHVFKDGSLYGIFPPEIRQPRYGTDRLMINGFKWKVKWTRN